MRKTHASVSVISALMDEPLGRHWGYDLGKRAKVRSGVLYPMLHRMVDEGLLEDGWEDAAEMADKRPPRRYYKLTGEGQAAFEQLLRDARRDSRFETIPGVAW